MLLDYNEKDKLLLDELRTQFKPSLDTAFTAYCNAEAEFEKLDKNAQLGRRTLTKKEAKTITEFERTLTEYSSLLAEYEEARSVITHKADVRETRYFAGHTGELAELLELNINNQIASFGVLQNQPEIKAVYQNDEEIKERIIATNRQYITLLQKYDDKNYQRIISFIDKAIANKENITRTYKITLKGNPANTSRWDTPYMHIAQNNATNDFNKVARLSTARGVIQEWGEMLTYQQGNLTIQIPHYEQLLQNSSIGKSGELNTPTKKILDIATIMFSNNGHNPSIRFSLDDYMKLCGLTDKKEARKQVNSALEVLFDVIISYDDSKNKKKSHNYRDMRLVDDKGIKNGIVYIHLAYGFSEMLSDCPVMPYPLAILHTSKGTQHRNAYYIARKMAEHKNMNVSKKNENTISVRALLDVAPYIPTEKEVRNSGYRSLRERIIKPFISDLEEACNSLGMSSEGYELHYAGGAEIPEEKLIDLDYETFMDAYVRFDDLPDYPDQTERLERKAAKKKRRTTKKGDKK